MVKYMKDERYRQAYNTKDKIIDLCGLGKPWSHYPGDKQFDVQKLIDNYISILEQRSINYQ